MGLVAGIVRSETRTGGLGPSATQDNCEAERKQTKEVIAMRISLGNERSRILSQSSAESNEISEVVLVVIPP
jgi:hypothetical protein